MPAAKQAKQGRADEEIELSGTLSPTHRYVVCTRDFPTCVRDVWVHLQSLSWRQYHTLVASFILLSNVITQTAVPSSFLSLVRPERP